MDIIVPQITDKIMLFFFLIVRFKELLKIEINRKIESIIIMSPAEACNILGTYWLADISVIVLYSKE